MKLHQLAELHRQRAALDLKIAEAFEVESTPALAERFTQTSLPSGVSRRQFLTTWRDAKSAGADDSEAWCERRLRCMSLDAWRKYARSASRHERKSSPRLVDERRPSLLEELGLKRAGGVK